MFVAQKGKLAKCSESNYKVPCSFSVCKSLLENYLRAQKPELCAPNKEHTTQQGANLMYDLSL